MKIFENLTTVPTRLQTYLKVFSTLATVDDLTPIGIAPMADGYKNELRIVSEFWVDRSMPYAMEKQLQISKSIIVRHLYSDVLDQLLTVKREMVNGNTREAYRLIEDLEQSILKQE